MNKTRLDFMIKYVNKDEFDINEGLWIGHNVKPDGKGYIRVRINYKQYYLHEVIAVLGGLDILNKTVDHINMKKHDNRIVNLEAVTGGENTRRARTGNGKPTKLSLDIYEKIRAEYATGKITYRALATKYGISSMHVNRILNHI